MIGYLELLRWLHVLGACVLIGTGAGIAFFMWMAHLSGDRAHIAATARTVIFADYLFTASAVIAQPVTGYLLAREAGWPLDTGWIDLSLMLYVAVGLFWLPVVRMQHQIRNLAVEAVKADQPLPPRYHSLMKRWIICGIPAFAGVLAILWLMLARPEFA